MNQDTERTIRAAGHAHLDLVAQVLDEHVETIAQVARAMQECWRANGAVYWCGNGGSAAASQHLAAELVGRFRRERRALASIALTTDTSVLTAVGNDYGYDEIFSRQIEAVVRARDLVFGLSASGNSRNVVKALQTAKGLGAGTVGLLGRDGGQLRALCDLSIVIASADPARIQEMHMMIGHILCDLIERGLG